LQELIIAIVVLNIIYTVSMSRNWTFALTDMRILSSQRTCTMK